MMGHERPPLGVSPRYLVVAFRVKELLEAMIRYNAAMKPVPVEWAVELVELFDWQRNSGCKPTVQA